MEDDLSRGMVKRCPQAVAVGAPLRSPEAAVLVMTSVSAVDAVSF
jgi:hypothetical protein